MDTNRLTGRLAPIILLVVSGAAPAVEVFTQPAALHPAQATATAPEFSAQTLTQRLGRLPSTPITTLSLTDQERERIAQDMAAAGAGAAKPFKIGAVKPIAIQVDLKPIDVGAMTDQTYAFAGGLVRCIDGQLHWAIRLDTAKSAGTRLLLENIQLPPDAKIHVYNDAGDLHTYTNPGPRLWTHTLTGNELYIQVEVPEAQSDDVRFTIASAMLRHPLPPELCPNNAPCVKDASCFNPIDWPEIDKARKAVASINFIEDGWGYACSGGLIADTDPNSSIPYFLTANHCINDPDTAATVETWFDYRTPSCQSGCQPVPAGTFTTLGTTLLRNSAVDDHSLLILDEPPPQDAWYLGWSSNPVAWSAGATLFRISHPLGAPQAFSTHQVDAGADPVRYCGVTYLPRGTYIFTRNAIGATEPASSGAPLISASGQVVGQLSGICGFNIDDPCDGVSNLNVDGAFANYYHRLQPWLDPDTQNLPLSIHKLGGGGGRVTAIQVVAPDQGPPAEPPIPPEGPVESQPEWPWQAHIRVSTWKLNGDWTCGGSVIHPNWVLTAAHCVVDDSDDRFNTIVTVAASAIEVRTGSSRPDCGGQLSRVKRVIRHPNFDPATGNNDIALLELKEPTWAQPIRPVTCEGEARLACIGTQGRITGWGTEEQCTTDGYPLTALTSQQAQIASPDQCRSYEENSGLRVNGNMICARQDTPQRACLLKDGSPLVVSNERGGFVQAGILSWSNLARGQLINRRTDPRDPPDRSQDCTTAPAYAVYTRLANYVDWLEQTTKLDFSSDTGAGVIDCGATCIAQYAQGSRVTLAAQPDHGSFFDGWQGACSSKEPTCEVSMTQAQRVKAIFRPKQPRSLCVACSP
ncbi:serine protease [Caldichromatium japonicum]|uniref:Serine protease n=1 Tax=Caldichromatium japonicum TaxID=2699430 RepID=A0A6G7VFE7_9GAMM|nr:trypsin-like serine protease [Caldichromatium japonicum]QIK38596.1 serine protease [Caldichromatium japonicum]